MTKGGAAKKIEKSRGFPKCLATPDKPIEALTKGENEEEEKEEETKEEEGHVAGPSFFRRRPGQLALVPMAQNEDLKEELGLKGPSKPSKEASCLDKRQTHSSLLDKRWCKEKGALGQAACHQDQKRALEVLRSGHT